MMSNSVSLMFSGPRPVATKTPVRSEATPAHDTVDQSAPSIEPLQTTLKNPTTNGSTPNSDGLSKLLSDLQSRVPEAAKELQFSVDQESGKSIVTLTDRATKEVLWQIPSEVALRISKELDQFTKGSLVNQKA